jgi:hypothetical protein
MVADFRFALEEVKQLVPTLVFVMILWPGAPPFIELEG